MESRIENWSQLKIGVNVITSQNHKSQIIENKVVLYELDA